MLGDELKKLVAEAERQRKQLKEEEEARELRLAQAQWGAFLPKLIEDLKGVARKEGTAFVVNLCTTETNKIQKILYDWSAAQRLCWRLIDLNDGYPSVELSW